MDIYTNLITALSDFFYTQPLMIGLLLIYFLMLLITFLKEQTTKFKNGSRKKSVPLKHSYKE